MNTKLKRVQRKPNHFPPQFQKSPGEEGKMIPRPEVIRENYKGSGKLVDRTALITGGDSGIGKWVDHIEWGESKVYVRLSRETIKSSPEYDNSKPISYEYEIDLISHYEGNI